MIKDIKVTKCVQNERSELVVSFIVRQGDYTEVEAELLRRSKLSGNMLDIEFTGLTEVDQHEERNNKLQTLGSLMSLYAEKSHTREDDLVSELYKKYKITSRKELTDSQLDIEIDSYRAGLLEFTV